jgi:hypothetical protein
MKSKKCFLVIANVEWSIKVVGKAGVNMRLNNNFLAVLP